jgi:hypothetical protein
MKYILIIFFITAVDFAFSQDFSLAVKVHNDCQDINSVKVKNKINNLSTT